MNVYLTGSMVGPRHNFDAFDTAAEWLRGEGFAVTSPHEMDLGDGGAADLRAALEADIAAIKGAELLVLLPGVDRSPGAMVELLVAGAHGVPVIELADLVAELER